MCGILGILPKSESKKFERALTTLEHRGPDGSGVWHDTEGGISLGHRRLSILDTSELGQQPMHFGRFVITYNGEIYNFVEIRKELEGLKYRFQSQSDTEVILAAYQEWGTDCLLKFNGMWSLAIWDKTEKRLFLSRDRFGKKPLFYAFDGDSFVFASEMKAIMPFLKERKASKDFKWCSQNIHVYEGTDKCLIDGIHRFPAGHYAFLNLNDIKEKRLSLTRYWNLLEHLVEAPPQYKDQVEQFRELFIDACRIRMRADVPIGTSLSGGMDSSAVTCAMAEVGRRGALQREQKDWQHAFVAVFPNTEIDERYYAEKVVEHTHIKGTYVEIDAAEGVSKLENYLYLFEELYPTPPVAMIETYKKVRENGVVVTLDGHGADELLAGYAFDLYETFFDMKFDANRMKEIVATRLDSRGETVSGSENWRLTKEAARFMTRVVGNNVLQNVNHIPFLKDKFRLPLRRYKKKKQLGHFNSLLLDTVEHTILPLMLRNYDRFAMAASVENRMPFLDHRVVSFLLSLPWESKIRGGFTKAILRDAMSPYMPDEVTWRKHKIGYSSPLNEWMRGAWKPYIMDSIHSTAFRNSDLINPTKTAKAVEKVLNAPHVSILECNYVWQKFSMFLWEKAFLKHDF
jgi:asparagine synthase (glutamine-hydrolysing)